MQVFYSILDVTGLDQAEVVEENSLERLCMNFCAEKVQQLQVRYLFKNEEAICLAEGISAEEFHYQDNADVVQVRAWALSVVACTCGRCRCLCAAVVPCASLLRSYPVCYSVPYSEPV